MGIKSKIIIAALVSSALTLITGLVVFLNTQSMISTQEKLAKNQEYTAYLNETFNLMLKLENGERGYLLSGDLEYYKPFTEAEEEFNKKVGMFRDSMAEGSPKAKVFADLLAIKDKWISGPAMQEMMARRKLGAKIMDLEGFVTAFKGSNGKVLSEEFGGIISKELASSNERNVFLSKQKLDIANKTKFWVVFGLLFAVLTGFTLLYITVTKVSKSIESLVQTLKSRVKQVRLGSNGVSNSSRELSDSSTRAAKTLNGTVGDLETLSNMLSSNAQSALNADEISRVCLDKAKKGELHIQDLLTAVESIAESSSKIKEIIDIIDDISFQTNLLALNAAVEAARAGEQGKGFSVVAEAVRSLAGRTAQAAQDVKQLIERSASRVEHGQDLGQKSGVILKEILSEVESLSTLVGDISRETSEQSNTLKRTNEALASLDHETQKNVESALKFSETGNQLLRESISLDEVTEGVATTVLGVDSKTGPVKRGGWFQRKSKKAA